MKQTLRKKQYESPTISITIINVSTKNMATVGLFW